MEHESESFIYTLSNLERTNDIEEAVTSYQFEFGGFNTQYENFKVEFLSMHFNSSIAIDALFYAHIDGLSDISHFSQGVLKPSAILLPIEYIQDNYGYKGNIFTNVVSARMKKIITITMLDSRMDVVDNGGEYNFDRESHFLLVMKVTPIS